MVSQPLSFETEVRVSWYADGHGQERTGLTALDGLPTLLAAERPAVWVDLAAPAPETVARVGRTLGLHPLIIEDVIEGNQRPKVEVTDGLVHVVLFHVAYGDSLDATEVDLVLGKGFLLSVHGRGWRAPHGDQLRNGVGAVLASGVDHLLWALSDGIVDEYFPVSDRLGEALDAAQDEVIRAPRPEILERVFVLKRQLHELRRLVAPVREVFNQLTNRDIAMIDQNEVIYFRDVYDHLIRLTDELDSNRELAGATLEVYLTQVNNSLSVIMKRLTGVTVILAGVGAVAGVFGMSEAASALSGGEGGGFWIVAGLMVLAAAGALAVLRRIDWI